MTGARAPRCQQGNIMSSIQVLPLFFRFTWTSWCFQEVLFCCDSDRAAVKLRQGGSARFPKERHKHTHRYRDSSVCTQTSVHIYVMSSSSSCGTHTHTHTPTVHCTWWECMLFSWCTLQTSVLRSTQLITSSFLFPILLLPADGATWPQT